MSSTEVEIEVHERMSNAAVLTPRCVDGRKTLKVGPRGLRP
jgi:hypothetical protein